MTRSEKIISIIITLILIPIAAINTAEAADINVRLSVDRNTASIGDQIQLSVIITGTRNIPAPELTNLEDFQVQYFGPATEISIINGRASSSVTHNYMITPRKEGKYTIGPITVKYRGNTFQSNSVSLKVVQGTTPPGLSSEGTLPGNPLTENITLEITAPKQEVYLNEEIPLTIRLWIGNAAIQDIQYPTFTSKGFSVDEFAEPRQFKTNRAGELYNVVEFTTRVYPAVTGQLTLGPAKLKGSRLVHLKRRGRRSILDDFFSDSFFGRYDKKPIILTSEALAFRCKPFPPEGKPENFTGAIGNYQWEISAKPTELKVGEPITLTIIIRGQGNIETVSSPIPDKMEHFKIYEPTVKTKKGVKESEKSFEQVIIPTDVNATEIPAVQLSYFDPAAEKYVTLLQKPVPLNVSKAPEKEPLKLVEIPILSKEKQPEKLGRDIVYIKDNPGKLTRNKQLLLQNKLYLSFHLVPLAALLGTIFYQRKKEKLARDIHYARLQQAPRRVRQGLKQAQELLKAGTEAEFYTTIHKTLQEYLGNLLNIPYAGITTDVIETELVPRGVSASLREKIQTCFQACDNARFASRSNGEEEMKNTYTLAEETCALLRREIGK